MDALREALHDTNRVSGLTHTYYRYPAALSPSLARALVSELSNPGDIVLDPFMGGGTVVVEALVGGRRAMGTDVNPLASLVTRAKTTLVSAASWDDMEAWGTIAFDDDPSSNPNDARYYNLPPELREAVACAAANVSLLRPGRERLLARCALLDVARKAVERRQPLTDRPALATSLKLKLRTMRTGQTHLRQRLKDHHLTAGEFANRRLILNCPAEDLPQKRKVAELRGNVQAMITSPPYPGVHVLYHRWQVSGRRESAAPYAIARRNDGRGPSYYTMGGRSVKGQRNYFEEIARCFRSLKGMLAQDAVVAIMVGFADPGGQLPMFLNAMQKGGYYQILPSSSAHSIRTVPNRRWYTQHVRGGPENEHLLLFRPIAF